MKLQREDYGTGVLHTKAGFAEGIIITKKALETWRDHYIEVSKDLKEKGDIWWIFYTGKADVITEILKHFEDEENESNDL